MHRCSNDKNIHVNAYKTKKSRLELYLHRTKWSRKPFVCQTPFRLSQRFSSVFLWKDMCNVTTRKSTAKKCSCTNVTEWNGKLAALFAHKAIKPDSSWRRSSLSVCVYVMSILSLVSHGFNCQKWRGRSILWQRRPFLIPRTCFWPVFTLLNWSCDLASHLTTWSKMSTRSQSRKVKVSEGTTWTVEVNNIPGKYTT